MRWLVPVFALTCCFSVGYAQDAAETPEVEVTVADDVETAEAPADSLHGGKDGCPCGGGGKGKVRM
jgi:hypothetical protein